MVEEKKLVMKEEIFVLRVEREDKDQVHHLHTHSSSDQKSFLWYLMGGIHQMSSMMLLGGLEVTIRYKYSEKLDELADKFEELARR